MKVVDISRNKERATRCRGRLSVEKVDELSNFTKTSGVAHLAQRLGFDLADPLGCDTELAADFFARAGLAVLEAEA